MSECHQLILRDLWAQERVTLTTDKMSQIEAMIESAHQQQEYMNQLTLAMQLSTQISASDRSALAALQSSRSGSYTFGRSKPSNIIIPPSSSSSSSFHTIDNNMNRHIEESEKSTDNNQEHDSKQQHKQQTILSSYSDINHPFIYPGFGLRCFDDCKIFSSNPLALRDCYENVYRSICKNDQFPVLFRDTRDRLSNGQIRDLTSNCDQSESTSFSTIHRSVPTTTTSTLDSSGENVKDKLFDSQTRSVYDYMQSQSGTGVLKSLRLDLIPKVIFTYLC